MLWRSLRLADLAVALEALAARRPVDATAPKAPTVGTNGLAAFSRDSGQPPRPTQKEAPAPLTPVLPVR